MVVEFDPVTVVTAQVGQGVVTVIKALPAGGIIVECFWSECKIGEMPSRRCPWSVGPTDGATGEV